MDLDLYNHLMSSLSEAAIFSGRIAPVFFLIPFFNNGMLPTLIKSPVIIYISLSFFPHENIQIMQMTVLDIAFCAVKEVLIGLVIGVVLSVPFWVLHAVGSFIDNQRGATISSTLDPSTGVDTSELAKFFNLFAAVVYLENNGMLHIVKSLHISYSLIGVFEFRMPNMIYITKFISYVMINSIMVSSPVIAIMLGAEIFLGILSRYASQLNAFAISLAIKSGLAFTLLLMYFYPYYVDKVLSLIPTVSLFEMVFYK